MLSAVNVSKVYRHSPSPVQALEQVSLEVAGGQFVCVRGPSGCGKTTLLLICGGLLAPDSGCVEVNSQDPYELGPDARAGFRAVTIGFVFQQFRLIPYLTVRENVLAPSLADKASAGAADRADDLLSRFGLADRASHLPGHLSTGQCQRVALARAMLNRPKLILADEPTGNLDEDNAALVLQCLAEYASAGGAVLLVTHDRAVARYADTTIELIGGRLAGRGADNQAGP